MRRACIVAMAALAVALVADPARAGGTPPTATLGAGVVPPGETVLVSGDSWLPGSVVQVQLCGNAALNGSLDCDRLHSTSVGVSEDGLFGVDLVVDVPPAPCPCLVVVQGTGTDERITLPIEVTGAPTATPTASDEARPVFRVVATRLEPSDSWTASFGARSHRDLVVTVENLGDAAIVSLPVIVTVGRGDDQERVDSATIDRVGPGERATARLGVDLPTLAFGTYTIVSTVGGDDGVQKNVSVSVTPWALLASLIVVALLAGLLLLRRRRRRQVPPLHAVDPDLALAPGGASLADDLARLIGSAIADLGLLPPSTDTERLGASIAQEVVIELGRHHQMDEVATELLTARLGRELSSELQSALVGSS